MKIILFQPQMPPNTGNIARSCAATGASLILVRPLGFSTSKRQVKRAGLDYWDDVDVTEIDSLEEYLEKTTSPFFFFSSKASQVYTEAPFTSESLLIFGSETEGLPQKIHERWPDKFYKIPMREKIRCLNLSNSAALVLYEALRQTHFELLKSSDNTKEKTKLITSDVVIGK